jgi:DNA-binding Lrp family transcriptional regulator
MPVRAYVLIQTEVGQSAAVARAVREIPGVESSDDVTGPYDVIVRATTESIEELGRVVVTRIQMVEGISRTMTCPIVSES